MTRATRTVLFALAALVVAPATGLAQAPPPAPPAGTLEVVVPDRESSVSFIDNPPRQGRRRPPTPGDISIFKGSVRDTAGARVGRIQAVVVGVSRGRRFAAQVTATLFLNRGPIFVQWPLGNTSVDTLAIVGGTGAYANARGTLVTTERRNDLRFVFNFVG